MALERDNTSSDYRRGRRLLDKHRRRLPNHHRGWLLYDHRGGLLNDNWGGLLNDNRLRLRRRTLSHNDVIHKRNFRHSGSSNRQTLKKATATTMMIVVMINRREMMIMTVESTGEKRGLLIQHQWDCINKL